MTFEISETYSLNLKKYHTAKVFSRFVKAIICQEDLFIPLQTYCVDQNVADSACSGTAYLSGVKANSGTVGLSGAVKRGDCKGQRDGIHSVTGLVDWAQQAGKSTGIILSQQDFSFVI